MGDTCTAIAQSGTAYVAESFAQEVDVAQAGVALEAAIYAPTPGACKDALAQVSMWLRRAQDRASDTRLAARLGCVADQVDALAAGPIADLPTFQGATLYPIHGELRVLSQESVAGGFRDAAITFWGLVGTVGAVLGAQSYIDYKARRGGYQATVRAGKSGPVRLPFGGGRTFSAPRYSAPSYSSRGGGFRWRDPHAGSFRRH